MNRTSPLSLAVRLWLVAALMPVTQSAQGALPAVTSRGVAFVHVNVVDAAAGTVRRDQTVAVRDGRIVTMSPTSTTRLPEGVRVLDATSGFLIPGLWDAHVHSSYQGACALPVFIANGVTSVRDAGARMDEIVQWRKRIASGELLGPRIRSAGPDVESGAWLDLAYQIADAGDPIWYWGPRMRMNGPADATAVVDSLAHLGVDFIKFRNLPRASFLALAAEARRHGMRIAGHAPKGTTLEEAAAAGLGSVEHAETVNLALEPLADAGRLRALLAVARAGMFVTPTLVEQNALWLTPDSVATAVLADSMGTNDPRRRYVSPRAIRVWTRALSLNKKGADAGVDATAAYARQTADMRLAHGAGVHFLAGTDLGSFVGLYPGASLQDELALLVRDVRLTPAEALLSATKYPAAFFGMDGETGTIAPGMTADLVLLDADPMVDIANVRRIRAVMVGGRLLDRAALDAALSAVATQVPSGTGCAREKVEPE